MKFLICYLAVLISASAGQLMAQSSNNADLLPKTVTAGPNTTQFHKFTTFEVAYHTGVPEIQIPIYTIESGSLNLPLTLSYHAGGNKVNEVPGWAGMGWSLGSGGKVTRAIVGNKADESGTGFLRNTLRTDLNTNVDADLLYINDIAKGDYDAEPDIFSYDVPGYSGRFFFNRNNNFAPSLIPFAPVRVNKYFNASTGKLWFDIANPEGIKCIFGDNYREVSSGSNGGVSFDYTTAWMLEKMVSADTRDTIAFSYVMQSSIPQEDAADTWVIEDNVQNYGVTLPPGSLEQQPTPPYSPNSMASKSSSGHSSITGEYMPTQILFKNGKIVFNQAPLGRQDFTFGFNTSKALQSIQIYNLKPGTTTYELLQTFTLYQSYFMNGTDSLSRRLRLDSVQVLDKNNVRVFSYRMQYDNQMLPVRSSKAKDLWGYYNGKNNNTLIPQMQVVYTTGVVGTGTQITVGSNIADGREVDSVKAQASILKRLYLPTGGYNDYEYESNRYLENGAVQLAGGLRIKSIKAYDPIGNTRLTRFYKYGLNENSAGTKNFTLNNSYYIATRTHRYWYPSSYGINIIATKTSRTIAASPAIDIVPWDGAAVVYPQVTEYIDSLGASGKTVVTFNDITDPLVSASWTKPVKNSYFFRRGQPLSKTIYKRVGSQYLLKEAEQSYYQAFIDSTFQNVGMVAIKTVVNEGTIDDGVVLPSSSLSPNDASSFRYNYYNIISGDNLLTSKVNMTYDDGDPNRYHKTVVVNDYNNLKHMQVSRIYQINSEGDTLFQTKKYAADYLSGNTTGSAVLDSMLARNVQTPVIEAVNYKVDKGTSTKKITGADLTTYKLVNSSRDIVKDTEKDLAIDGPVTNFVASSISGGALQFDSRYQNRTVFNNYNTGGALSQFTEKMAGPTAQLWDYNNEEVVAVAVNANISEVAYTSFETATKGNFIYTGTATADATAPTGQMVYNLGQTSGSITFPTLSSSQSYRISYWTKNSTPYTLSGTQTGYPIKGLSYQGWTYYEHKITGITSLTFSGTGMIDELRLCPFGSRMGTRSVNPLVGVTATADDAGNLKLYEYDSFNRFKLAREFNNIIKTIEYQYKK
ncbi:hypothetical protein [Chitinophaga filiformis]|uniref:YD repeat-containing protein n=1 Tax=Chitinophaga filiformis TaxID=104663 RepID=A0ABY4HZQ6_CHIFI|nr:hypothetical protein [Chitinophaga filiformis]UPK67976.1 hypothetical protein MYF79_23775 [Chitinophaga filiformis]